MKTPTTTKTPVTTRKKLTGTVVSDTMDKTVVVNVNRYVAHKKYGKYYKIDKHYKAHDEKVECKIGDRVEIAEVSPVSKTKRWKVVRFVQKATSDNLVTA